MMDFTLLACATALCLSAAEPLASTLSAPSGPTPPKLASISFDPEAFLMIEPGGPMPRDFMVLDAKGLVLKSRKASGTGTHYLFEDPAIPMAHASIFVRDGRVTGAIDGTDGLRTFLTSIEAGHSRVEFRQPDLELPCGMTEEQSKHDVEPGAEGGVAGGPCDNGAKVDVMVVYTSAAITQAGSVSALIDEIDWAIADSNTIYDACGIGMEARVVSYHFEGSYVENADMGVDLSRLAGTSDGFMDGVHTIRDNVGADLVTLIRADGGGACGIAYLLNANTPDLDEKGFSVTALGCFSNRTFTHELGHNMGCCHAPGDGGGCTTGGVFPYSVGHRFTGSDAIQYRTVMAYAPGTRIPRFSSPGVSWAGTATGISNQRDNARTINETRLSFTNFRCSPGGTGNCGSGGNCYAAGTSQGCQTLACCQAVCAFDSYCCETIWDAVCAAEAIETCSTCGETGSSCFTPHATPSCNNGQCCASVCAQDSYCCNTAWDALCVSAAEAICPNCGDAETGSCYVGKTTPHCSDAACCNAVCATDPFCCDTVWDSICAARAIEDCPGCGNPTAGSCYQQRNAPYCADETCCDLVCSADPFCCNTAWDLFCVDRAAANCPGCGNPNAGNCLAVDSTPYCADEACCTLVCDTDPFCCDNQWDNFCVSGANLLCVQTCGGPLAGDCCTAHANPYCNNEACCDAICAFDSFCCNSSWDSLCASSASNYCASCDSCPTDCNNDGVVNAADITAVLSSWGTSSLANDVNDDGIVNALDIALVLAGWGPC